MRPEEPRAPTAWFRSAVGGLWKGLLAAAALAALFLWWLNSAPPSSRDAVFAIPPGAPASRIGELLESAGQVRSREWFMWLIQTRRVAGRLHAGVYQLKGGQTASAILNDLVQGQTRKVSVTVPEGWASWQIAERLDARGICSTETFKVAAASAAAEGYMFPETYYLDEMLPADMVLQLMRGQFEQVWSDVWRRAVSSGAVQGDGASDIRFKGRSWTRHEIVTLASLVEREAQRKDERALISAVYHNRLRKRMLLEADPTVQYALGYWKSRVLFQDLEIDSPYNTYRRRGLPPGPICNPGREALAAALAPAPVDYLYFVADVSGGHHFSSTYAEHLDKVRQWNAERRSKRIEKLRRSRSQGDKK